LAGLWRGFRSLPVLAQLVAVVAAAVVAIAVASVLSRSGTGTNVSARSSTSLRLGSIPSSTTTTIAPLPAGDDKTVKNVIDGDSLELTDGTKIRLIGIDAPDVETKACFSSEATSHLQELLAPGRNVRVAYDVTATDRFSRTLAYVYRLPDGLFINVAMARDGFAIQLSTGLNIAHTDEIEAGVADARNGRRGLWQSCDTTTTTAGSGATATTTAPAPTGTIAPASTTTAPPASTATTTGPPALGAVQRGTQCLLSGAPASFSDGTRAVCTVDPTDGVLKWQPA
jgi:micrococcal nuclease